VYGDSGQIVGTEIYDVGRQQGRVLANDGVAFGIEWLADSRRIVSILQGRGIAMLDVDSGERRVLTAALPWQSTTDKIVLSRDGRTLYVGAVENEADVWLLEKQ
jgi:hypothetical protein